MDPILFYSTNRKAEKIPLDRAMLVGLAPDRGLYMPVTIPKIPDAEIRSFSGMTYPQIAFRVLRPYAEGRIPLDDLASILEEAYDFDVPLEPVRGRTYLMRLDQGPTASFKDFAARLMGRLMQYFITRENRSLLILTATSGDTGSAIASAFHGLDNIRVVVLFPQKEVTARQRRQMTTLGGNVLVLALDAKFDDCQALVKRAFSDPDLAGLNLSSANSINIGRLLPQAVYYFYAFAKLRSLCSEQNSDDIVFSVPSGNFGDMMGGLLAGRMGLPIRRMIISVNENDSFPKFLDTETYWKIAPSRNCLSSAMNVGHPSNLARVVDLYDGMMDEEGLVLRPPDFESMRKDMVSYSIFDRETEETIRKAWKDHRLLLEPHGAVAWAGLERFVKEHPDEGTRLMVSLETAHPAKFPEKIVELLSMNPALPPGMAGIEEKKEFYGKMENDYARFKTYLMESFESRTCCDE